MLSSVLRSPRAIQTNVMIMRAFVRTRELIAANQELADRVNKLEQSHDRAVSVMEVLIEDIENIAAEVKRMKALPPTKKGHYGFKVAGKS